MKVNIFDRCVSVFEHVTDKEPKANTTLRKVLNSEKIKVRVEEYRCTKDKAIKNALPAFTASGIIEGERKDSNLVHSGVLCIDIDKKDNLNVSNFGELKSLVQKVNYIAYCGLSVGGEGYFLLVPIKYPQKHREHFKALQSDFEQAGLKIDAACINEGRLRFVSSDSNAYYNDFCDTYDKVFIDEIKVAKNALKYVNNNDAIKTLLDEVQSKHIDLTANYQSWVEIGAAIASEYGEQGREYFHTISQQSEKYKAHETDRKYSECLKMRNFSIGTLYYHAKQHGIIISSKTESEPINRSLALSVNPRPEKDFSTRVSNPSNSTPVQQIKVDNETSLLTIGDLAKYLKEKAIKPIKGEMLNYCKLNNLNTDFNLNC